MEEENNYETETRSDLTLRRKKEQNEIKALSAVGLVIVVVALGVGGYMLMQTLQTGRPINIATTLPILAGLALTRLITAPLKKKRELVREIDEKLGQME